MTAAALATIAREHPVAEWTRPRVTPYIPGSPTAKQAAFLLLEDREAFFGGAAGAGKSVALLMAALQYVDVPGYAALLLRRTYQDLALPGALMDRAREWLEPTDASWQAGEHTWRFPSGATLTFGYLENERDRYRYQSAEFQYVGFDELTQFTETAYRFLFSRLRRIATADVPLRMRGASNPGGVGHEWVKQRFLVEGPDGGRAFVPAQLDQNPHLDRVEYEQSLANLDPVTRAQLLRGDWSARPAGAMFRREWFPVLEQRPAGLRLTRFWDLAATEAKAGRDPDWTVGALVGRTRDGQYVVCDIRRTRSTPGAVEQLVRQTAAIDGPRVTVRIEQEPGASGVNLIDRYVRHVLPGYSVKGDRPTGDKLTRAMPLSSMAEAGNVSVVRGRWLGDWFDEAEAFPDGSHDDQVDAVASAFNSLAAARVPRIRRVC